MRATRRRFIGTAVASAAAANRVLAGEPVAKAPASERVRVGVVGAGGRARSLNNTFAENRYAEVVAIADLDPARWHPTLEEVTRKQGRRPRITKDFRYLIDDPQIDAIVVGTPDHWHAIPTILACMAGKDVYVEKPDAHNIIEGRRMIPAMRKYRRIVQMGSQHRSTAKLASAQEFVRSGALGRCLVAKAWESSRQGSIGFPPDGDPPPGVDYDMWLGPAPKRPFNPNRFHGRWRWFFDYGTGDLGNDGVHRLDMAMALLEAACERQGDGPLGYPKTISASGGKWYFNDMQEFPDTLQVTYRFGETAPKLLTYEMRIWAPYRMEGETEGAAIYGDQGYLVIGNGGWRAYGPGGRLLKEVRGDSHERPHVQNFLECVKTRRRPNCDLETIGHRASVLCHAGNISARVGGRTLVLDQSTETFVGDEEANRLRGRPEWRKPWVLPEV